jgi:hypothetical protein
MPITQVEADRRRAEAAARGLQIFILDTVTDPSPSLADRITAAVFPWLFPDAEAEAEL